MNDPDAVRRLLEAVEMHEYGVEMKRRTLRREHPTESEREIDARLARWLGRMDEEPECP